MNKHNNVPVLDPLHDGAAALQRETAVVDAGSAPAIEDLKSVGTRIRWGAILAGASLALGIYFLLGILGAAVGVSIGTKLNSPTLSNGAIAWAIITTCTALFLGGLVASVFTVGENKVEAVVYGIILWAVLLAFFVGLGAAGVQTGFNSLTEYSNAVRTGSIPMNAEAATRVAWYAFVGVWLSMLAAAGGAFVGAGPTFRLVSVSLTTYGSDGVRRVDNGQRTGSYMGAARRT